MNKELTPEQQGEVKKFEQFEIYFWKSRPLNAERIAKGLPTTTREALLAKKPAVLAEIKQDYPLQWQVKPVRSRT